MTYFVVKAQIYIVSPIHFINFILYPDNTQEVSARTVGRKVTF